MSDPVGSGCIDGALTLVGFLKGADVLLCSSLDAVLGRSVRGVEGAASPVAEGPGVRTEGVIRAAPILGGFAREAPAPTPGTMLAAFGVGGLKLTGDWPATWIRDEEGVAEA